MAIVKVGLMAAREINVRFHGPFLKEGQVREMPGWTLLRPEESPRRFLPAGPESSFELQDVTIGIGFHWEERQAQRFHGALLLIPDGDKVQAINEIEIEEYLKSVVSSEMSCQAGLELLKAHAVISRSWLLARIGAPVGMEPPSDAVVVRDEPGVRVKYYDNSGHRLFHVCADDHCQRYHGISRIFNPDAVEAVEQTRGMVLTDCHGAICDARYSKCCGGAFEQYSTCWESKDYHYLAPGRDLIPEHPVPDLSKEVAARAWIESEPDAFCNTSDSAILARVLNNFDRATTGFYRWTQDYTQTALSQIIRSRTGIDFGRIRNLTPLRRGVSGRISLLSIEGEKLTMEIGRELEIRRTLSRSHLLSSAFVVCTSGRDSGGYPLAFTLHGAGWGHGVGLCQIGAAMMAQRGYDFRAILAHYYPGATLTILPS